MSDELEVRRAKSWEEVDRAAVVTARAFGARPNRTVEPDHFRARMIEVPGLSLDNVLLGFVDDQLVCGLQLYDRWTAINGYRLPVAGVGNVMTDPDHQGRGYATRLLNYATDVIEDKGYPVSLLRGNRSLYTRQGWKRLHAIRTAVDRPRPIPPAGVVDHAEHEFVHYGHDRLDELMGIHRSKCRRSDANLWRSRSLWEDWIFEIGFVERRDILLYETDSGEVEGYLAIGEEDGKPVCREIGHVYADDDESEAFLTACWNELAGRADDRLVWRPPALPAGAEEGGTALVEERASSASMKAIDSRLLSTVTGRAITSSQDLLEYVKRKPWYWPGLDGF